MILATYFDGRTSRAQPVRLAVEAGEAVLFDAVPHCRRCACQSASSMRRA